MIAMMEIVSRTVDRKCPVVYPPVKEFKESALFYKESHGFTKARNTVQFKPGFKCKQCDRKSRQRGSPVGYCFVHKRMVDMNETCDHNTCSTYKNVNMPR